MPLALCRYNVCPAALPALTVVATGVPVLPDDALAADVAWVAGVLGAVLLVGAFVLMLIGPLFGLFSGIRSLANK